MEQHLSITSQGTRRDAVNLTALGTRPNHSIRAPSGCRRYWIDEIRRSLMMRSAAIGRRLIPREIVTKLLQLPEN